MRVRGREKSLQDTSFVSEKMRKEEETYKRCFISLPADSWAVLSLLRRRKESWFWLCVCGGTPEHPLTVLTFIKAPEERAETWRVESVWMHSQEVRQDASPLGQKSKALHQKLMLTGIYLFRILKNLRRGRQWGLGEKAVNWEACASEVSNCIIFPFAHRSQFPHLYKRVEGFGL